MTRVAKNQILDCSMSNVFCYCFRNICVLKNHIKALYLLKKKIEKEKYKNQVLHKSNEEPKDKKIPIIAAFMLTSLRVQKQWNVRNISFVGLSSSGLLAAAQAKVLQSA